MAASSKPTGVHIALIIFVLLTIACGVGWLMAYKGAGSISELKKERDDAKSKLTTAEKQFRDREDDIRNLKTILGSQSEDVGPADGTQPNSVIGEMKVLKDTFGSGVVDPTLKQTFIKLSQQYKDAVLARDKLQEQLATEHTQFEQRLSEINKTLDAEKKARSDADKGKSDADKIHQEEIAKKDTDLGDQKKALDLLQSQYDELKDSTDKRIADLDKRITQLVSQNKRLVAELDEKTRPSFERPSGQIRFVDTTGKKVWIDIGEAEGVRPRTTFSVYKKQHSGVGRGTVKGTVGGEDIKGSIEITRVLEPHLSEARILSEDIYHPIMKGDPIYSPLWSPGHDEAFSFVGIIDLNGDKKDDRDMLQEIVATAGAVIDNDVTPDGILKVRGEEASDGKPVLTERTKFLVIGRIPEIADAGDDKELIAKILEVNKLRKDLEDAARERGVRVVSLSDFLAYVGYKQQRRLFIPGTDVPYNLKSGSHSTGVDETVGNRTSAGSTSGAYSGDKALKPKSTGNSTSVFRGSK
ncbi:MAG: hypothetical protein JSS02_32810 [Planctomycetes bacterium]|nr:hypothetical protein [Planctomycetota bacterium]